METKAREEPKRKIRKIKPLTDSELSNFWIKVVKLDTGCWDWAGYKNYKGYGDFSCGGKINRAHRISFFVHKGEIPDGLLVCHSCDNRWCVNPDHLFVGTSQDNSTDMVNKGRSTRRAGEDSPTAKVTEKQALQIIQEFNGGQKSISQIARDYGVGHNCISYIVKGKTWKHLQT